MPSVLGPAALVLWAYISGKSLAPMLQLLHITMPSYTFNNIIFESQKTYYDNVYSTVKFAYVEYRSVKMTIT